MARAGAARSHLTGQEFRLSVTDGEGRHVAASPYAVQMLPTVETLEKVLPRGPGRRGAVVASWGEIAIWPGDVGVPSPYNKAFSEALLQRLEVQVWRFPSRVSPRLLPPSV